MNAFKHTLLKGHIQEKTFTNLCPKTHTHTWALYKSSYHSNNLGRLPVAHMKITKMIYVSFLATYMTISFINKCDDGKYSTTYFSQ